MGGGKLQIVFDYIDPGSYLTWAIVERVGGRRSAEAAPAEGGNTDGIRWIPLELRPPGTPLQDPQEPDWRAMTEGLAEFAASEGIPFGFPEFLPRTRKAHELARMADEKGCFSRVHEALFDAHFNRAQDIGRIDLLVRLGEGAGMDPAEVRTVLGVDRFLPAIESAGREADTLGVRGVPTLIHGARRMEGFLGVQAVQDFLAAAS